MKYWITLDGIYYEAVEKEHEADMEVAQRKPKNMTWNPEDEKWNPYKMDEWTRLRFERYPKLQASDFSQLADAPFTPEQKAAWAVYRQALRDLQEKYIGPDWVVWPTEPT